MAHALEHPHILNSILDSFMSAAKVSGFTTLCTVTPSAAAMTAGALMGLMQGGPHEAAKMAMEAAKFAIPFGLTSGGLALGGGLIKDFVFPEDKDRRFELVAYILGLASAPTLLLGAALPVKDLLNRPDPVPQVSTEDCVHICPIIPPGQPGSHYPAPSNKGP